MARLIRDQAAGRGRTRKSFRYIDKGTMATIGRMDTTGPPADAPPPIGQQADVCAAAATARWRGKRTWLR